MKELINLPARGLCMQMSFERGKPRLGYKNKNLNLRIICYLILKSIYYHLRDIEYLVFSINN